MGILHVTTILRSRAVIWHYRLLRVMTLSLACNRTGGKGYDRAARQPCRAQQAFRFVQAQGDATAKPTVRAKRGQAKGRRQ